MSTYKIIEVIGTSELSWDDAARNALETARKSIHDIRIAEVTKMDLKLEEGTLVYRTRMKVSFKYIGSG